MAESSFWEKSCESCLEEQKQVKARTLCFECHEFLCEECSKWHMRFKKSKGHHLIDLVPFTNKLYSPVTNEDELSSDFLENLTISDSTVLYNCEQVAIDKKDIVTSFKPEKEAKFEPGRIKVTKCFEFSVERAEDEGSLDVRSILQIRDVLAVAVYLDESTKLLRIYDNEGNFVSSTQVPEHIWGMTSVDSDTFATCGSVSNVSIWKLDGQSKINEDKKFNIDFYMSQDIHFNGTYYCVLHVDYNSTISVLDRQGGQIRKISLAEAFGKKLEFGWDIHMDNETNTIYVPCRTDNGVLSVSMTGIPLWFCPLEFPWGITEIHGTLFVTDGVKRVFHLLSKTGIVVGRIPTKDEISGQPRSIHYRQDGRLYQGFHGVDDNRSLIFVYSISVD